MTFSCMCSWSKLTFSETITSQGVYIFSYALLSFLMHFDVCHSGNLICNLHWEFMFLLHVRPVSDDNNLVNYI